MPSEQSRTGNEGLCVVEVDSLLSDVREDERGVSGGIQLYLILSRRQLPWSITPKSAQMA